MPQNRRNSKEDVDGIHPAFLPPSRVLTPPSDSGKEPEKRKKKEKKWSLGGLFRRRKIKDSDTDTSSQTEEEEKKGFLDKRRSARKKRNRGSKDVTGSFEHIVINRNSTDVNNGLVEKSITKEEGVERLSVRSSHETLSKKQEGQSHGSSVSLDGSGSMRRSGRMKVMARVEASRDRLRADSSSDEGGSSRSRHSISSSLQFKSDENFGSKDSSLNRKSRAARTERYIKRQSKDEDGIKGLESEPHPKISRSDERLSSKNSDVKIASGNRWTAKVVYYESSDYDTKYTAKTRSATPSPIQSPKARPKNLLHQTSSAPPTNIYTTFPPGHIGSHQELRSHSFQGGAFQRVAPKSASMQKVNENVLPKLPKSKSDVSQRPFYKQSANWDQKFPGTKSASFDSNINVVNQPFAHAHPSDSSILCVQFPISRPNQIKEGKDHNKTNYQPRLVPKQNPPPPPPRDPQRRLINSNGFQQDSNQRPMSYAFESRTHPQQPKVSHSDYNTSSSQFPFYVKNNHPLPINKHHRSNSDQQLPSQVNYLPKQSPPTQRRQTYLYSEPVQSQQGMEHSPPQDQQSRVPQHYQYYTDQQPRSRKPIHIAYNSSQSNDQPYLSDSQVVVKPPYQQVTRIRPAAVQNASEFWKQKEQETSRKLHLSNNSPKVIQKHLQNMSGRTAPNNPRHENSFMASKLNLPPIIMPIRRDESTSSLSGQSDVSSPRIGHQVKMPHNELGIPLVNSNGQIDSLLKKDSKDVRPLSMVLEKSEASEHETTLKREKSIPPAPPVRRCSRQNSVSSAEPGDMLGDDTGNTKSKRKSSNLEEALNELEAIYKSLRLGEEDLLEKVERRERLAYPDRLDPKNWNAWVQSRGFESDSSFNYSRSSIDSTDSPFHKNLNDSRNPPEPDRVADDMAYRRLNKKDRPTSQEHDVISQAGSFLLVSPTLSPPPFAEAPPIPLPKEEPDVTLDDVVYRNIKHVNNTLKVLDPQPPFGIPLGPISPAPNSDYLHVTAKERYKSTFKPRKTPDVVADDLAFRNLRKDSSKDATLFNPEDTTLLDLPNIKKKRAIRSLSANLLGIIQKESYSMSLNNNNSLIKNNNNESDFEKSRSITDLPDSMITHRLHDNKENLVDSNIRQYSKIRHYRNLSEDESDFTVPDSRTQFGDGFLMGMNTSTETLTDSRANLQSHDSKTRTQKYNWLNRSMEKNNLPPSGNSKISVTPERNQSKNFSNLLSPQSPVNIAHSSRSPSPQISITPDRKQEKEGNSLRQYSPSGVIALDNINVAPVSQTESDLLAILAKEARATSEQLSRELKELNQDTKLNKSENDAKHTVTDQNNKSSLSIGKVVHHKPVKLNTFFITEDKKSENKITDFNESVPTETSKSMTDLLKELTRSLDNDFGSDTKIQQTTVPKKYSSEFNTSQQREIVKEIRTKKSEDLSEDSNSESINTICQSASSLTTLSNSPLRGLSPIRKSKENVCTQKTNHPIESDKSKEQHSAITDSKTPSDNAQSKTQEHVEIVTVIENPTITKKDNDDKDDVTEITANGSEHCPEIVDHEPIVEKSQLEEETCQPLESTETCVTKPAEQIKLSENVVSSEELQKDDKKEEQEERSSRPSDCSAFADEGTKMSNRTGFSDASTLLLVCSYCMACAHQLAGLDNLTILGLFLAMASVLLFLIC